MNIESEESTMKTQTVNIYSPNDLVKLLGSTSMSLRHIAEETEIPFPTLRNYRYEKTDADAMPYKMVARLSEFFLSQNYNTIDALSFDLICIDDNKQLLKNFKVNNELLDLYTLHEIMLRFYGNDKTKYDDVVFYLSSKAYNYLNNYITPIGHPVIIYLQRAIEKGCHIIYSKELSDKLSDLKGSKIIVKKEDNIQLPMDNKNSYIIGDKKLKPLNESAITTPNIEYYVEVILGLKTDFIKNLYKDCGIPDEKAIITFLSEKYTLNSDKWGYNIDKTIVNIYQEIQEQLLKTNIYVNLLAGRYDIPLEPHTHTEPGNPCGPRNSLNPKQNIRLYDINNVNVKTSYEGINEIKQLIRPVDFDWRKLIHEYGINKDKPIDVIINLELGISIIQSISFFIESNEHVTYSL